MKNRIKRRIISFIMFLLLLNNNIINFAGTDSWTGSAGFTIGGGSKGNPVWSFANVQSHIFKFVVCNENGQIVVGPQCFYDKDDTEIYSTKSGNIGIWPKSKYNATYNYSARGGCLVCEQPRTFNFLAAAEEITGKPVKYIDCSGVIASINFGAGIDFMRPKYKTVVQYATFATQNNHITDKFKELVKQLGIYESLGITPGDVTVELEIGADGNITTATIDSFEAYLRGYTSSYKLNDKKSNRPYFALCKVDWLCTSNVTTTKEKTPDGKTDFIIEKFAEPLQCKPCYEWGNIVPATDIASLQAQIPGAIANLGTTNTNLGITSGWC